jgi:hypothetical protein
MTRIKVITADERWKFKSNVQVAVYELNDYNQCEWFDTMASHLVETDSCTQSEQVERPKKCVLQPWTLSL